jgi:hypothetical protein
MQTKLLRRLCVQVINLCLSIHEYGQTVLFPKRDIIADLLSLQLVRYRDKAFAASSL